MRLKYLSTFMSQGGTTGMVGDELLGCEVYQVAMGLDGGRTLIENLPC